MSLNILKLPIAVNYYISDLASKGGRANKVTLKLDVAQMRKLRLQDNAERIKKLDLFSDSLYEKKFELDQKIYYQNFKLSELNKNYGQFSIGNDSLNLPENEQVAQFHFDNSSYLDSLGSIQNLSDSLDNELNKLNSLIEETEEQKRRISSLSTEPNLNLKFGSYRFEIPSIKKFTLGNFVSPSFGFSIQNIRLVGLNTSLENDRVHFDLVIGKIAPLYDRELATTTILSRIGLLSNTRGELLVPRVGLGTEKKSHIYGSFLVGKSTSVNQVTKEEINSDSKVFEIDAMLGKEDRNVKINLADVLERNSSNNETPNVTPPLWKKAGSLTFDFDAKKIKISSQGQMTYIGPSFYTVGNPYLRADQLIRSIDFSSSRWKRLKPTVGYLHKNNDVFGQLGRRNSIRSFKAQIQVKLFKNVSITGSLVPTKITMVENDGLKESTALFYQVSAQHRANFKHGILNNLYSFSSTVQLFDTSVVSNQTSQISLNYSNCQGLSFSSVFSKNAIEIGDSSITLFQMGIDAMKQFQMGYCQFGLTLMSGNFNMKNSGVSFGFGKRINKGIELIVKAEKYPSLTTGIFGLNQNMTMPYLLEIRLKWTLSSK